MVILWNLNLAEREELLQRICTPVNIKRELIENISSAQKALQLFTPENSQEFNVKIYNLLKPLNIETIILMMIYAKEWQKKAIFNYLTRLKDIKPLITGEDLKKLGIQPGPVYRKILESILREKLQGDFYQRKKK